MPVLVVIIRGLRVLKAETIKNTVLSTSRYITDVKKYILPVT